MSVCVCVCVCTERYVWSKGTKERDERLSWGFRPSIVDSHCWAWSTAVLSSRSHAPGKFPRVKKRIENYDVPPLARDINEVSRSTVIEVHMAGLLFTRDASWPTICEWEKYWCLIWYVSDRTVSFSRDDPLVRLSSSCDGTIFPSVVVWC